MNYATITKLNLPEYLAERDVLVCLARPSRNRAKQLAILELSIVLGGLGEYVTNGPLGDVRGVVSFFVKKGHDDALLALLKTVGYCNTFYKLDFSLQNPDTTDEIASINPFYWKGRPFHVIRFYAESEEEYRERSIENREFAVLGDDGAVRRIKGYRGDGSEAGRRGLPLEDAVLMVNLADPRNIGSLFDPFAGGGGILHAARTIRPSLRLLSCDVEARLEPGLRMYANVHRAADARELELGETVDAIVTEVPFSGNYTGVITQAFDNLSRFLRERGRVVCMCSTDQFSLIAECLRRNDLHCLFGKTLDRKGTTVSVSLWTGDEGYAKSLGEYFRMLAAVV